MGRFLICLIALFLAGQEPQTSEISFDHEVARLDTVLAKLSETSKIKLTATDQVAHEIVFLHVDKRPLEEVLQKIAASTCAEWRTETDGSRTLFRSDVLTKAMLRKEHLRKLNLLNRELAKLRKGLDLRFTPANLNAIVQDRLRVEKQIEDENISEEQQDKAYARRDELDCYDPTRRALARCLSGIDTNLLVDLPPQTTITYCSRPNQAQRALPQTCFTAMDLLNQEQILWGEALKKMPPLAEGNRFQSDESIQFFEGDETFAGSQPWARTVPFKGRPVFALLKASNDGDDTYGFELTLVGEDGRTVAHVELDNFSAMEESPEDTQEHAPLENPKPSPATAAFMRIRGRETLAPHDKKDVELLKPFLDDPLQHEPLWLGNQELLSGIVKLKGKSVIACLPEEASALFTKEPDMADFLYEPSGKGLYAAETDHWMEFRPQNFAIHWRTQANRGLMADYVRSFREKGRIDIIAFAKLCSNCGPSAEHDFATTFVQFVDPNYRMMQASFVLPYQTAFTDLLAKLDSIQMKRLERGETIPYRELTPEQRAITQRIVFGTQVNMMTEGMAPDGLWLDDATVELPGGLLQGAGLSATMGDDQVVLFHNNTGAEDVFYSINLNDNLRGFRWRGPGPRTPAGGMQYATYDLRVRKQITLKCALTPGHCILGKFEEPTPPQTKASVPLSQLPKDVQAKLGFAIKFLGGMSRDDDDGDKNGDPPPPQ